MHRLASVGKRRSKQKYAFTIHNAYLMAGPALLPQPPHSSNLKPATLSLTWRSGKKIVNATPVAPNKPDSDVAAQWKDPLTLTCSVYSVGASSRAGGARRNESRHSELALRIDGGAAPRRKLAGFLDLSAYASIASASSKVVVPLGQGAGTLHFTITSAWIKPVAADDDGDMSDGASSMASTSTSCTSASTVDAGAATPNLAGGATPDPELSAMRPARAASDSAATPPSSESPAAPMQPPTPYSHQATPFPHSSVAERSSATEAAAPSTSSRPTRPTRADSKVRFGEVNESTAAAPSRSSLGSPAPTDSPRKITRSNSFGFGLHSPTRGGGDGAPMPRKLTRSNSLRHRLSFDASGGEDSEGSPPQGGACASTPAGDRATLLRRRKSFNGRLSGSGGSLRLGADDSETTRHRRASIELADSRKQAADGMEVELPDDVARASAAAPSQRESQSEGGGLNGGGGDSLFKVPLANMEEVLFSELPISLDDLEHSFLGMDSVDSRFGKLLCARLGYSQLQSGTWEGNEMDGLKREVNLVVKCPPKPLLPDFTRVVVRQRLQRSAEELLLEREVATLDVPYGDAFRVQERWVAKPQRDLYDGGSAPSSSSFVELRVHTHIFFKGRVGLMASKIRHHSTKKSRKVAAQAAELLLQAHTQSPVKPASFAAAHDGEGAEVANMRQLYAAVVEEADFLKRRMNELERENKRLVAAAKHVPKSKNQLVQEIQKLQDKLVKEQRERALMEEMLTSAYNTIIREILEGQSPESAAVARKSPALARMSMASTSTAAACTAGLASHTFKRAGKMFGSSAGS